MREDGGRNLADNEGSNNNAVVRGRGSGSSDGGGGGEDSGVLGGGESRRIRIMRPTRDEILSRRPQQHTLLLAPAAAAGSAKPGVRPPTRTAGGDDHSISYNDSNHNHHHHHNSIGPGRVSGGGSSSGRLKEAAARSITAKEEKARVVQVVYYLTRNGQLEHPHYMELDVSHLPPHQQLLLRDVLERLKVLRGVAMPSQYSWSCKRSYKNGYVWNDLAEDDIIYPSSSSSPSDAAAAAAGDEYVLKGCEISQHIMTEVHSHHQHNGSSSHTQEGKVPQLVRVSDDKYITAAVPPAKQNIPATIPNAAAPPADCISDPNQPQTHLRKQQPCKLVSTATAQQLEQDPDGYDQDDQDHNGDNFGIIAFDDHDQNSASCTCSSKSSHSSARCSRGVSTDDLQLFLSQPTPEKTTVIDHNPPPAAAITTTTTTTTSNNTTPNYDDTNNIGSKRTVVDEDGWGGHDPILTTTGFTHSTRNSLLQLIACGSSSLSSKNQLQQLSSSTKTSSNNNNNHLHKRGGGPAVPNDSSKSTPKSGMAHMGTGGEDEEDPEEVVMIKYMSENPRFGGFQCEEKEYFSGSIVLEARNAEKILFKGDETPSAAAAASLKKSSSYKEERASSKSTGGIGKTAYAATGEYEVDDEEFRAKEKKGGKIKCIPRNVLYNCYYSSSPWSSSSSHSASASSKGIKPVPNNK